MTITTAYTKIGHTRFVDRGDDEGVKMRRIAECLCDSGGVTDNGAVFGGLVL